MKPKLNLIFGESCGEQFIYIYIYICTLHENVSKENVNRIRLGVLPNELKILPIYMLFIRQRFHAHAGNYFLDCKCQREREREGGGGGGGGGGVR